jgi:hypothetical protein
VTIYQPPRKPVRAERCETCRFFSGDDCRRHPPVSQSDALWPQWPEVRPTSWCGEFAPKKQGA